MRNTFERNHTASAYRGIRKLLRGTPPDPGIAQARQEVSILNGILIKAFLVFALVVAFCIIAKADQCQDPALKPELVKACYQMEKVCKEIGCSVALR